MLQDATTTPGGGSSSVDALLADHLNGLSLEERERCTEDIHGVAAAPADEDPFEDRYRLELLAEALEQIPHKPAYDTALLRHREHLESPGFRRMFLRAEPDRDPSKAAARLVRFLEKMRELLGAPKPFLEYQDLNTDDRKALRSGHFQFLPVRDRSGRRVFCNFQSMFPPSYPPGLAMFRSFVYMNLKAAEDEETQRKGLVVILYQLGDTPVPVDPIWKTEGPQLPAWLPIRVAAVHVCLNPNPLLRAVAAVGLRAAGETVRSRFKLHDGTPLEIQYKLLTFGLPIGSSPLTSALELKKQHHTRWIAKQRAREEFVRAHPHAGGAVVFFGKIDVPGCHDVLSGTGKFFQQHSGNRSHLEMVLEELEDYAGATTKPGKDAVVRRTMERVRAAGGRYLRKDRDGWWVEVSDEEAFRKTKKSFSNSRCVHSPTKPAATTTTTTTKRPPERWEGGDDRPGLPEPKRIRMGADPELFRTNDFCLWTLA